MKKQLLVVAFLLGAAAVARGQDEIVDVIYEINNPPTVSLPHTILSAAHTDSVPANPATGDMLIFDTGWTRLAYGADGDCLLGASGLPSWGACPSGGGGAPTTAHYFTTQAEAGLSAEFSLGGLGNGLLLNAVSGGVSAPTIYGGSACTNQFIRGLDASGAATCNSVALTDHATQAANTVVANVTGGAAAPTAVPLPACTDTGGNHLNYTAAAGFSCGTSSSTGEGGGARDASTSMHIEEEFAGTRSNPTSTCATNAGWAVTLTNSALGTNSSPNPASGPDHQTSCQYDTGIGSNMVVALGLGPSVNFYLTGNETWKAGVWLTALSNATAGETYRMKIGPCNVASGATCVNGAWFEYTDSVNSGNWTICSAAFNIGSACANTSTAATAGSTNWHQYKITTNSDATALHFFIDGAEVANSPLVANIPKTSSTQTGLGNFVMGKTGGTTTSYGFAVDYYVFDKTGMSR